MSRKLVKEFDGSGAPQHNVRWVLRSHRHEHPLGDGEYVFGRARHCHICIEDPSLSREHARLKVFPHTVVIHDLGSANGVYVNGHRIQRSWELREGDRLTVGQQQFRLCQPERSGIQQLSSKHPEGHPTPSPFSSGKVAIASAPPSSAERQRPAPKIPGRPVISNAPPPPSSARGGARRQQRVREAPSSSSTPRHPERAQLMQQAPPSSARQPTSASTGKLDSFTMLGEFACKALALGNRKEAEESLGAALTSLVQQAEAGERPSLSRCAHAAKFCCELAAGTQDGRWLEALFRLHLATHHLPPSEVVDELFGMPLQRPPDLALVRRYIAQMEALEDDPTSQAGYILGRLQAWARLMATRS